MIRTTLAARLWLVAAVAAAREGQDRLGFGRFLVNSGQVEASYSDF